MYRSITEQPKDNLFRSFSYGQLLIVWNSEEKWNETIILNSTAFISWNTLVCMCLCASPPSYTAAIAGKCQVMELQAERTDRHTKRDSLILSAVSAQRRGPATTSHPAIPSSCQASPTEGVCGDRSECVCVRACVGLDGKRVTIETGVKEECGGGVSVKPPENLHIKMYGHRVITSKMLH